MARRPTTPRAVCYCGHRHHAPDELARIADQMICPCARCFVALCVAARIGRQLALFEEVAR